ncbi:MAG: glycosyltransferase [Candidatus Firestonebacteria bacterium]
MKVLQINKYYYPVIGGIENHLKLLCEEISKKIEVSVLVSNIKAKTEVEKYNNLEIVKIASLGKLFSMPLSPSFPVWLKKINADILHFHHPFPIGMFSYLIAKPKGKIVLTYHSDIVRQKFTGGLFAPVLNSFMKKADCIIATSPNLIESSPILKNYKEKCRVIPLGIDVEKFKLKQNMEKIHCIQNKFKNKIVLFVGRLIYYKGLEYLIKSIPKINAHFVLIGDGPLKNNLKQIAKDLQVENKITFLESMDEDELISYYWACDLFVLPSIANSEAFGIVQLEAMTCGKPVVSTNLPTGVSFVNLHQKTGLVVTPKNSDALAQAINTLLEREELRKEYGENAKQRVEKEFTKEKMVDRILKLYNEI